MTPNPGFKVTGYLKVEYLADGARVFNCTKHSCRSLGALPKTCKKIGDHRWNYLATSAETCFTPLTEIKHNSVSLRSNFYGYIQVIGGRFWLQLQTVKKFSEPRVSWKYLAKMWKNSEIESGVCSEPTTSKGAAYWVRHYAVLRVSIYIACL